MSKLLRFTEFVKERFGDNHVSIADYFDTDITTLADECSISWSASKHKVIWDGGKNGGSGRSTYVSGLTPDDKGRVYIFATVGVYEKDGVSFTYPKLSFQNMRNSLSLPNRKFNGLTQLFDQYNTYKKTRQLPRKNTNPFSAEQLNKSLKEAEAKEKQLRARQRDVIKKEPLLFSRMVHISNPKVFSPYLGKEKKLDRFAENFDIRIGSDQHGYFTCFPITTIEREFKGLQRIYHHPPESWDDRKRNTWGVNTTGLCAFFGDISADDEVVYLCEGMATALAMRLATGRVAIACLYAGNIEHVSKALSLKYPNLKRVHVADNDNKNPAFGNTGVYQCALSVARHGGFVFVPEATRGNDVCDVYVESGLDELKRQIYQSTSQYFNGRFSKDVAGIFNYIHVAQSNV